LHSIPFIYLGSPIPSPIRQHSHQQQAGRIVWKGNGDNHRFIKRRIPSTKKKNSEDTILIPLMALKEIMNSGAVQEISLVAKLFQDQAGLVTQTVKESFVDRYIKNPSVLRSISSSGIWPLTDFLRYFLDYHSWFSFLREN